jgi:hypothetical protein
MGEFAHAGSHMEMKLPQPERQVGLIGALFLKL